MRRMEVVNTQYVVFRHHDKPHAHVHVVYNRVDNDGNAITGDQGFRKSARITQALTQEYGLTFGKSKKKVNRHRLKGKDAVKYRIYDVVNDALRVRIDWKELKEYLSEKGITVDITSKTNGRIKGVVFTCDNISFGGYRIDRTMTYRSLDRRLNTERGLVFADSPAVSASLSDWIRQRTDDTDGNIHRQGQQMNLQAALSERRVHRTADFPLPQISEKRLWNWLCNRTLHPHRAVEVAEAITTKDGGMMTKKKSISLINEESKL